MADDDDDDFNYPSRNGYSAHNGTTAAPSPRRAPPAQQSKNPPPRAAAAPPTPAPVPASDNLLGLDDNKPLSAPASNGSLLDVAPSSGEGSLLDMHVPTTSYANQNVRATSSHDDFLGMTSTPISAPAPAPAPVPPSPSSYGMPRPLPNGTNPKASKAFETFANKSGPFGGLEWK